MTHYERLILLLAMLFSIMILAVQPAHATSRIKDVVEIEGVRENMLVGYGLVVGLNGTGDSLRNAPFTKQSLESMLERLGINIRETNLNTRNIAAVMVTAYMPPFSRQGSRIDVAVSSLGDAQSLLGGTLLVTPLLGADGEVYAVSQGTIATASVSAQGASGSSVVKGVPTSGRIAAGAIIEREVPFAFNSMNEVRLSLRNPDFSTATKMAATINQNLGVALARADDSGTISVRRPANFGGDMSALIARIENLPVQVDTPAKVIIDEVSGIIVIGENVRLSRVAIAQGNLTISVQENPAVSQPNPFGNGETAIVPQTDVTIAEETGKKLIDLKSGASLQDLVDGLNTLGVTPRDMIAILQAIKAAGALQADIEVM